jgi:DNA modification methylase
MATWAAHHEWCAWHKTNPMPSLSKRHWTWDGELIPYATRGKHTFNFPAKGHAPSIWDIPKSKETSHPTEKPVAVPEMAIRYSSKSRDVVLDPFLGSGTTLIACERLNRKCRAVEIAPKYVAVTLQRWHDMTGEEPVLVEATKKPASEETGGGAA